MADAFRPTVYCHADWSDAIAITYIGKKLTRTISATRFRSLQSDEMDCYSVGYMQGPLKSEYKGGQAGYVQKIRNSIDVVGVAEGPLNSGPGDTGLRHHRLHRPTQRQHPQVSERHYRHRYRLRLDACGRRHRDSPGRCQNLSAPRNRAGVAGLPVGVLRRKASPRPG